MKVKLNPKKAYVIGLWQNRQTKEGIGVQGREKLLEAFVQGVLEAKLITSNKILTENDKAYFYHSKYKKFFQDVIKNKKDFFKYKNNYSAAYFAGFFESNGGFSKDNKTIYIAKADLSDEIVLLNTGFKGKLIKNKLIILDKLGFLGFILPFRKIKVSDEDIIKLR